MRFLSALLAFILFCCCNHPLLLAQSNASPTGTVSKELIALFEKTKTITSEADVTAIARACSSVVPDKQRSEVDRKYASSLLAWSLNRRGEMRSSSAAALVEQGKLAQADELDRLAAEDYKTAIEYAPSNWRNRHNYAIALAMKGQYQNAIKEFNAVIRLKDDYANAYFNRGELYFELQQYAPAVRDYTQAIELDSKDPQYYNSRGHCRFALEVYDEALEDYRQAVEFGNENAVFQTDLADALQFLGRWEDAAKLYRQAVASDSKFARAYQNAAWLMCTCPDARYQNIELGLSAAKKAIELEVDATSRGLDTLAAAQAASGKFQEAVATQKRAVQTAPESDRDELASRLALYERSHAYLQPQSNVAAAKSTSPAIRTASAPANTR